MSDGGNPETGSNGASNEVGIQALTQFIKDLSFENPGAMMNLASPPETQFNIDPQVRQLDLQHYEVELRVRISAKSPDDKPVFLLELVYAGIFMVHGSPPEDFLQQILLIDSPQLLFPFVRQIVSNLIQGGGLPPLLLPMINFAALYRARAAEGQQQRITPQTPDA
jgi:preprotein translocase subunit SecB